MLKASNPTRILGITGSPRRDGNTEMIVDQVLQGATETGALSEKVILNKLNINPCRACNACRKTGRCVQQDDMHTVLEQMEQSQVWVLGTPVYYWGPTAQFKAFIDRWYGAGKIVTFNGKRVILAIPLGAGNAYDARHTTGMLEDILAWQRSELFATILALGVLERGAVRGHSDVLAAAHQAGRDAVETLN